MALIIIGQATQITQPATNIIVFDQKYKPFDWLQKLHGELVIDTTTFSSTHGLDKFQDLNNYQ